MWCDVEFGYKVSRIINAHIETENRRLTEKADRLETKVGGLEQQIAEMSANMNRQHSPRAVNDDGDIQMLSPEWKAPPNKRRRG